MTIAEKHPAFVRADALPEPVARLFPHSAEEARAWTPQILHRPLASRVLVVAVPRVECAWSAYIDAVPGVDHRHRGVSEGARDDVQCRFTGDRGGGVCAEIPLGA